MTLSYDITSFMQWWLAQVLNIFRYALTLLESIEFMGTNLLQIIIAINIIAIILNIFLSIGLNESYLNRVDSEASWQADKARFFRQAKREGATYAIIDNGKRKSRKNF